MPRYVYGGLFVILVATGALFFYTTTSPSVVTHTPTSPEAEFGGVSLRLAYATTSAQREKGLGGRSRIAPDEGMLFVFPKDGQYGFWMKDTLVPLDIFWLDSKGQAVAIFEDVATSSYPNVFYPMTLARYVLETVSGFARAHQVATGTPLRLKNFPTVTQ